MEVTNSDSGRKLRSSFKTRVGHSESCQDHDSLVNDRLSDNNSHSRKRMKKRLKNGKLCSLSDNQLHNVDCVKSNNGLKLFPIFTSNSRMRCKLSTESEPKLPDPEETCQRMKSSNELECKITEVISYEESPNSSDVMNSKLIKCTGFSDSEVIEILHKKDNSNKFISGIDGSLKQNKIGHPVNDIKILEEKLTFKEECDVLLSADSVKNKIKPNGRKRKKNTRNEINDSKASTFENKIDSEKVNTEIEFVAKCIKNNSLDKINTMKSERDKKFFPIFNSSNSIGPIKSRKAFYPEIKKCDLSEQLTEYSSFEKNLSLPVEKNSKLVSDMHLINSSTTSEFNCSSVELVNSTAENAFVNREKYEEQLVPNTLVSNLPTPIKSLQSFQKKTCSSCDQINLVKENFSPSVKKDLENVEPERFIIDSSIHVKSVSNRQSSEVECISKEKGSLAEAVFQYGDVLSKSLISDVFKEISSSSISMQTLESKDFLSTQVMDLVKRNLSVPSKKEIENLVSEEFVTNSILPLLAISSVSSLELMDCTSYKQVSLVENAILSTHEDSKGLNSLTLSKSMQKDSSLSELIDFAKEDLSLSTQNDSDLLAKKEFKKTLFTAEKSTSTVSSRTRKKQKVTETGETSAENSSNTRVTRSQTLKNNCNLKQTAPSLPTDSSVLKPDVTELVLNKTKKKMRLKKSKPDVLRLLHQSKEHFKKGKNKLQSKNINHVKVFPIFSKSETPALKNKSITQVNTSVQKSAGGKEIYGHRKQFHENKLKDYQSDDLDEIQCKNVKSMRKRNKTSKASEEKTNITVMSPSSDDSILKIEVNDSSKNRSIVLDYSESVVDLESVNKSKNVEKENIAVLNKHKDIFVVFKKVETLLPFPIYSHCNFFKWEPDYHISNYHIMEDDFSDEINIPEWNKITGLTEVKNIDHLNVINHTESKPFSSLEVLSGDRKTRNENAGETDYVLWTDISNDYNLKEGISETTIENLNSWLLQWKLKFSKNSKIKQNNSDDSFDSFSSDSNDSVSDDLSNSVIIMGPPGCGKTSLVFSLANDHGFKVLEVNASSCRSGRNINHQLKEALESYHVENIKIVDINFEKEKHSENTCAGIKSKKIKDNFKQGKTGYLQKEKKSVENKNIKNQLNVRNFFQVKSPSSTKPLKDQESKISVDKLNCTSSSFPGENHNSTSCSISTQTIILFDDIDVVFQEDEGLWSTIRGFLRISKKPVIFTVSRNLAIVKANLDADIKVLNLKPMIQDLVIEKLSNQYEKHYRKNTNMNIKLLVNNCNDVRRSLLHGQFWSQQCIIPSHVESSGELLSTNTFLLGSMDFSASDFISFLFKNCTLEFSNILSHYHGIGYDVLHSNIFTIFNVILEFEVTRSWQSVIRKHEHPCNNIVEINTESESDNCIQTDLRQEAYKISKEHTLQKNSLNDLFVFSNIFDDFSFIDILKGHFCRSMKWISLPDRIKKWTLGLPVCSEEDYFYLDDIILEVSSLIQLLRLQHAQNKYFYKYDSKLNKIQTLILEHPIVSFDYVNGHKVQMQIENIASVFSASSLLNKTVLNLDYLSTLKIICQEELLRRAKSGKRCNRFLHYFDSISLFVDKYQIEQLLD